jgi:hypothetical protein
MWIDRTARGFPMRTEHWIHWVRSEANVWSSVLRAQNRKPTGRMSFQRWAKKVSLAKLRPQSIRPSLSMPEHILPRVQALQQAIQSIVF